MVALRAFLAGLSLFPALVWAQTAIRPDQITPGTPDITWGQIGSGYQIGSTVPWRTDSTTAPTFTCAGDNTRIVELTNPGPITATLPAATGCFGDGAGFTIQVAAGTLTLNAPGGGFINGLGSIKVGPYQSVGLASRGSSWYAAFSVPQPATQTGSTQLCDNMAWGSTCTGGGGGTITFVRFSAVVNCSAGVSLCANTINSTAAGNLVVAGVFTSDNTNVAAVLVTSVTTNGTPANCSQATGAALTAGVTYSGTRWLTDIWYCPNVGGGNLTVTMHIASTANNTFGIQLTEYAGASTTGVDVGIGNHTSQVGTTMSVAPSGNLTQNNQLIYANEVSSTAYPGTVGSCQTGIDNNQGTYCLTNTSGTAPAQTFNYPSSQNALMSVAVFKHP